MAAAAGSMEGRTMKYAIIGRTFDAVFYKTEDEARKALYDLPEAMLKYDGEVALAKAEKGAKYWTVIEEAYTGGEEYEAEW